MKKANKRWGLAKVVLAGFVRAVYGTAAILLLVESGCLFWLISKANGYVAVLEFGAATLALLLSILLFCAFGIEEAERAAM